MSVQTVSRQPTYQELERQVASYQEREDFIFKEIRAMREILQRKDDDTDDELPEENPTHAGAPIAMTPPSVSMITPAIMPALTTKREATKLDCAIAIISLLGCILGVTLAAVLSPGNNINLLLSGLTGMVVLPSIPIILKYKI